MNTKTTLSPTAQTKLKRIAAEVQDRLNKEIDAIAASTLRKAPPLPGEIARHLAELRKNFAALQARLKLHAQQTLRQSGKR